jgi:hypothetical protein
MHHPFLVWIGKMLPGTFVQRFQNAANESIVCLAGTNKNICQASTTRCWNTQMNGIDWEDLVNITTYSENHDDNSTMNIIIANDGYMYVSGDKFDIVFSLNCHFLCSGDCDCLEYHVSCQSTILKKVSNILVPTVC